MVWGFRGSCFVDLLCVLGFRGSFSGGLIVVVFVRIGI